MAGQSQAANLGGMLSQIGNSMGSMGSAGNGLLRPLENTFRPEADPTDIGSMQNLMQWQSGMGRGQEAALTGRTIADMEAKQYRAKKDAEAADEKEKAERNAKLQMGFKNAYANAAGDPDKQAAIRNAAQEFSQREGVDMTVGLNQIDQHTNAQASAQRARDEALYLKGQRDLQAQGKALLDAHTKAKTTEEAEAAKQALKDGGHTTLYDQVVSKEQRQTQWAQQQADYKKRKAEEQMVPITEGEREILDRLFTQMDSAGGASKELSDRLKKDVASLEANPMLTNKMKREKISAIYNRAEGISVNEASAAAAAQRRAAEKLKTGGDAFEKVAPMGLYEGQDSIWYKAALKAKASNWWPWAEDTEVQKAIKEGGDMGLQDIARIAANLAHNDPSLSSTAALEEAAKYVLDPEYKKAPAPAETTPATGGNGGTGGGAGTTDFNKLPTRQ